MTTLSGRPDPDTEVAPRVSATPGPVPARPLKRGRDTVLAPAPRLQASPDPASQLSGLTPEQRLVMQIVDGRLSVARLARLAGLSEENAAEALAALVDQGLLVTVDPIEVTIHGKQGSPFFKLGPYEVAAQVGQGGMGSVYVCRRTGAAGFRRLYALKVVRQGSGQEAAASQSFAREIAVGRLLSHPNVQSVVDVRMHSDQLFIVLDYIEGTDLEELLSVVSPLPPGILVTILMDVLRGLHAAHETLDEQGRRTGLMHGDVSPANLLIGLDGVTRLSDFGNTRFTAMGENGQNEAIVVGKPAFMAPEQFRGEPLDARADLFAVGVVMWTALTGRELFAADSVERIGQNVLSKEIVPPSTFGAPGCLDDVCMRALSRHPRWRYASADEMAEDLLRVAMSNGLRATPTQVADYVRFHLGTNLTARRRLIEGGFYAGTTEVAPTTESGPIPGLSAPSIGRKKLNPTVVLNRSVGGGGGGPPSPVGDTPRRPAPRAARRPSRWLRLFDVKRPVGLAFTISLALVLFTISVVISNRLNATRALHSNGGVPEPGDPTWVPPTPPGQR